jgi:uncharacterized repeat protein (TIGR03943 family)
VRRDTQNVLLVLLGGALIKISATELYLRYVRPASKWYLLTAGVVILMLAATSLLRDAWLARGGRPVPAHHGHGHDHQHGHGHGHGHEHDHEPHSPWLLLLPVLAIFLVAPPALGADSVQRTAAGNSVTAAAGPSSGEFAPLPAGAAPELRLSDFVTRAVWDRAGSLAGRDVTLTGFVVHRGGSAELARLVITCCAADARPMVVRLSDGGAAPDLPSGSWLRLRARLLPGSATVADGYTPSVQVLDAEPIPEPVEAYEY